MHSWKDHYPDLLPSFKDLDPAERQSVQFTQSLTQLAKSRLESECEL